MRLSLAPLFHPQRPIRQWLAASLCAWSVAACAPGKAPSVVLDLIDGFAAAQPLVEQSRNLMKPDLDIPPQVVTVKVNDLTVGRLRLAEGFRSYAVDIPARLLVEGRTRRSQTGFAPWGTSGDGPAFVEPRDHPFQT